MNTITTTTPNYPTAHEVMSLPVDFRISVLAVLEKWKEIFLKIYKQSDNEQKLYFLSVLLTKLAKTYDRPVGIEYGISYHYNPRKKTIVFDKNHPSIISALHEFAHHIYGRSELDACRWSIWLFKKCFPITWKTLKFQESPLGLLLVKKPRRISPRQANTQ